jgi:hypothetical protein
VATTARRRLLERQVDLLLEGTTAATGIATAPLAADMRPDAVWEALEPSPLGHNVHSVPVISLSAGAELPLGQMKTMLVSGDDRCVQFALHRLTQRLRLSPAAAAHAADGAAAQGRSTVTAAITSGSDVFELSVVLCALLRMGIATPAQGGASSSGAKATSKAELVARRVLSAQKTDLFRVHQCVVCLRLLCDVDVNAVAQALWQPVPKALLSQGAASDSSSTSGSAAVCGGAARPPASLMVTLAHATESSYTWAGLNNGGAR